MENRGFTIVELIVIVTIITILTGIIISNFPQAKLQLSLSRVAYKFEQDARRAQGMSLSYPQFKDSNGILHPVKGYGVYVDILNNKKYIIYADSLPGNQRYDDSLDYVVETIDFSLTEPGIIIKQINSIDGNSVSVNFAPPNPITTITPSSCYISIVFALESDLTKTKTVSINTAGLIQVANIESIENCTSPQTPFPTPTPTPAPTSICPAGSPEVIVDSTNPNGALYSFSGASGQYHIELYSPEGLTDGEYVPYSWSNWFDNNIARIHGGDVFMLKNKTPVWANTMGDGLRVANYDATIGGGTHVDPPYNESRKYVADWARGYYANVILQPGDNLNFIVNAIKDKGGIGDFIYDIGSLNLRICPIF